MQKIWLSSRKHNSQNSPKFPVFLVVKLQWAVSGQKFDLQTHLNLNLATFMASASIPTLTI